MRCIAMLMFRLGLLTVLYSLLVWMGFSSAPQFQFTLMEGLLGPSLGLTMMVPELVHQLGRALRSGVVPPDRIEVPEEFEEAQWAVQSENDAPIKNATPLHASSSDAQGNVAIDVQRRRGESHPY